MSNPPSNDKRRHPRVEKRLRVRSDLREAVELETIDLSAGGLSCTAPVFLPLMTKMAVSLVLPANAGSVLPEERVVKGEAVVVRSEPPIPSKAEDASYRVALFFSRMDDADRRRLLDFLARQSGRAAN